MFNVGDTVYHPTGGAGVIARLKTMATPMDEQEFYEIHMVSGTKTTRLVPIAKARELGLRRAIDKAEISEVLELLAADPEDLPEINKQRYRVCQDKVDTAVTTRIAETVRDLAWQQHKNEKLSAPGHRIYKTALKLLVGELAVAQDISLQDAGEQVDKALSAGIAQEPIAQK